MSPPSTHPQQVNLIDPSLLRKPERLTRNNLLTLMGISTMVVAVHAAMEQVQMAREHSSLASSPVAQGAQAAGVAENTDASTGQQLPPHLLRLQEQVTRGEALRSALAQNGDLPDDAGAVLKAVIEALPPTIWLTELQVLGDKSLLISGGTLERPALATFSKQLEVNPTLKGTPITKVELKPQARLPDNVAADGSWPQAVETPTNTLTQPAYFAFTLATRLLGTPSGSGDE